MAPQSFFRLRSFAKKDSERTESPTRRRNGFEDRDRPDLGAGAAQPDDEHLGSVESRERRRITKRTKHEILEKE
jgi:hypothetical protein